MQSSMSLYQKHALLGSKIIPDLFGLYSAAFHDNFVRSLPLLQAVAGVAADGRQIVNRCRDEAVSYKRYNH